MTHLKINILHLRNSLLNFTASVNFPAYKAVRIKYRDRVANSPVSYMDDLPCQSGGRYH